MTNPVVERIHAHRASVRSKVDALLATPVDNQGRIIPPTEEQQHAAQRADLAAALDAQQPDDDQIPAAPHEQLRRVPDAQRNALLDQMLNRQQETA